MPKNYFLWLVSFALFFAKLSLQALLKNSTKKPLYIVSVFVLNGLAEREK
jgi:hypothetical protein